MRKKGRNVLDLIPEKNCPWQEEKDGTVTLLRKRFKTNVLRKIAVRFGRSEHFHIHLDGDGTRVWGLVDDKRTVEEIGQQTGRQQGESEQQAYERLAKFLIILQRNRFVRWKTD